MNRRDKQRLEKAGWRVGDAKDFLDLTKEEMAFIELRLALAARVREARAGLGLTQAQVARLIRSSQSRIAKLEACDPSVSSDLLLRCLIALGVSIKDIGVTLSKLKTPAVGQATVMASARPRRAPPLRK